MIFVSHRWEADTTPDPYGTQLWVLKKFVDTLLRVAIGLRQSAEKRLKSAGTLRRHGALQAAYFVGAIAGFVDTFKGGDADLRTQLSRRIGIVYDYLSLPQQPRSAEEQAGFDRGMMTFRRLMGSAPAPTLALRYPDDEYGSRGWCELEFWAPWRDTVPVLRVDLWGKEIPIRELGPPGNYNRRSAFDNLIRAVAAWESEESITAKGVATEINEDYRNAFSLQEKEFSIPVLARPDFSYLDFRDDTKAAPPSFGFYSSVRENLYRNGLENEDFSRVLKAEMAAYGIGCSDERDIVLTALWLLGSYESVTDPLIEFYGRCLLRYLYEGKDLRVRLLLRLPGSMVHFAFFDGEESTA